MNLAPLTSSASAPALPRGRLGFGFARRFLLLWALGFAWTIPAVWDRTFLYAMAVWDGLLLAAWLGDLLRLPRAASLAAERRWPAPPSIGSEAEVEIVLRNDSASPLDGLLMDEIPAGLGAMPAWLPVRIPPHDQASVRYRIAPIERGDTPAGRLFLRYRSRLELAERWAVADLRQTVRVYPDFEHARRHSMYLVRSRQIELQMRLLRIRGQGREFESLREYREGDEPRDICWTATARRGKLVTKIHQVERSQAVWIVLDCGRLMRARTAGYSKLDWAVNAALCLSQLAMYSGDLVGLLAYGRKVNQRVAVGRGPAQLRHLVEQLAVARTEAPEADHLRAAASLLAAQKRRGLIVWLTDLAETSLTPDVVEAASRMQSRHLLLFVVIGNPELRHAADRRPDNEEEMFLTAAAQEMVSRREVLLSRLRERGALALEVEPGKLSAAVLNQYLRVKERNLL